MEFLNGFQSLLSWRQLIVVSKSDVDDNNNNNDMNMNIPWSFVCSIESGLDFDRITVWWKWIETKLISFVYFKLKLQNF